MRTELKNNEKVTLVSKIHWFVLVGPTFFFCVCFLITIILLVANEYAGKIFILFTLLILLVLIWRILERKYNIWIVTN